MVGGREGLLASMVGVESHCHVVLPSGVRPYDISAGISSVGRTTSSTGIPEISRRNVFVSLVVKVELVLGKITRKL